jgi:hypothetical protein
MEKIAKTRAELATLLLNKARGSGKCRDLASVFITGPFPDRTITWGLGRSPSVGRSSRASAVPNCKRSRATCKPSLI